MDHGDAPIHIAARSGDLPAVTQLVRDAPDAVVSTNALGDTALMVAIKAARSQVVHFLLAESPSTVLVPNDRGKFPVHAAIDAYMGLIKEWRTLVDERLYEARTAVAAMVLERHMPHLGNVKVTKQSLRIRAGQMSMLHLACFLGHVRLACLVLRVDAAAGLATGRDGNYPIHMAARRGCLPLVSALLDAHPPLARVTNDLQETALHGAAESGNPEVVRLLLRAAPDTALALSQGGYSPLWIAAAHAPAGSVWALLQAAPSMAERPVNNTSRMMPVHAAAYSGNLGAVELLLDAAPHTAVTAHCNVLYNAILQRFPDIVKAVLRRLPGLADRECVEYAVFRQHGDDLDALAVVEPLLEVGCAMETWRAVARALDRGLLQTACALVRYPRGATSALELLRTLQPYAADPTTHAVFVEAVKMHVPMSPECWALVPHNIPGLLAAMPTIMQTPGAGADVAEAVRRMPGAAKRWLRTCVRSLRSLPPDLVRHTMCMSL